MFGRDKEKEEKKKTGEITGFIGKGVEKIRDCRVAPLRTMTEKTRFFASLRMTSVFHGVRFKIPQCDPDTCLFHPLYPKIALKTVLFCPQH